MTDHEHLGDAHDPDFCVYTRADGERCMTPVTLRGRCLELGAEAMGSSGWRWWAPRHLAKLFDLWEPLIRADERLTNTAYGLTAARAKADEDQAVADERERLRTQVKTLPVPLSLHNADCPGRDGYRGICDCEGEQLVRKSDVLALLPKEKP